MSQGVANINSAAASPAPAFLAGGAAGGSVKMAMHNARVSFSEATNETIEDLSIALAKFRDLQTEKERGTKPKVELREVLIRVTEAMPLDGDVRHMFSQLEAALAESDNQSDLMGLLTRIFHDPAIIALVVQSYLAARKKNQKRLSDLLDEILESMGEDTSIILFGALHFGAGNKEVKAQINRLYHETAKEFTGIIDFYRKLKKRFRKSSERKKAVLCLLHSYAEDLHDSSNELFKIKIVHVIHELKRLSTLLGMDEKCREMAVFINRFSDKRKLFSDQIMDTVIEWLDTVWIYSEMLPAKLEELSIKELAAQIVFLQSMVLLFKHLPAICYEDEDCRSHIENTLQEKINEMALQEEEQ